MGILELFFDNVHLVNFSYRLLKKLSETDFSIESFPLSTHQLIEIQGRPCRAIRVSPVGEMGNDSHSISLH